MSKAFNLVIVHTAGHQGISDWQAVAAKIEKAAPEIEVRIADNDFRNLGVMRWQATRPSLVFSAGVLRKFKPRQGVIYVGKRMTKWEEINRFVMAGVSTPATELWSREKTYATEVWGDQVIVKPTRGLKGQGIQLLATGELPLLWERVTDSGRRPYMVQRFIDSGPRPNHFRVLTGFGLPLYMARRWATPAVDGQARAPHSPEWRLVSNDSEQVEIMTDDQVLTFAGRIAGALPEIPILGSDIVREASTGRLFAMEANSYGQTWHFSSDAYKKDKHRTGELNYYAQFGALDVLAAELVRRVRSEAR